MRLYTMTSEEKTVLYDVYRKAYSILDDNGIIIEDVDLYMHTSKKRLGVCLYSNVKGTRISFSRQFLELCVSESDYDALITVMLHEMLHAYCYQNGDFCGHKGLWKILAEQISRNTKYNITRLFPKRMFTKTYRYELFCADCGNKYLFARKGKVLNYITSHAENKRYYCHKCHSFDLVVRELKTNVNLTPDIPYGTQISFADFM